LETEVMMADRAWAEHVHGGDHERPRSADPAAVVGAVREDIRQTLRCGWVDPALEAAASSPAFFAAAWSAIRPNVGKSFLALSRALRTEAVDAVRTGINPPDLRKSLQTRLSQEELRRAGESARAAHLASPKVQIVVHALSWASRGERVAGTGQEESPVRRGIPDWQRWMSSQPAPDSAAKVLDEIAREGSFPTPPSPLRLMARWPAALEAVSGGLRPALATEQWRVSTSRLRRIVLAGISTLPHPVELQWTALKARGFTEKNRQRLAEVLLRHDAAMAGQTLIAAFVWEALGSPEIGVEG
jgi:hypothetical protein